MTRRIENGADFRGPLLVGGSAGTSGQVLTSAGAGAVPTWSSAGGVSFTGGTLTSNLTLAAGTTSLSPMTMQSGTNLTTATAGAVEYDGKVIYSTPAGRGVSPSMMYYRLNADLAGANVATAQNVFGVGVTLQANTVYCFEQQMVFLKSSGAVSHNLGMSYGGTATVNNILYQGNYISLTLGSASASTSSNNYFVNNASSNFVLAGAFSTSSRLTAAYLFGSISINAGGTFIPQYTLSAAPGGAYSTNAGSYFAIWPIGAAGANTSVGPWA